MNNRQIVTSCFVVGLITLALLILNCSCQKTSSNTARTGAGQSPVVALQIPETDSPDNDAPSRQETIANYANTSSLRQTGLAAQYGIKRGIDLKEAEARYREAYEAGDLYAGLYLYYQLTVSPGLEDRHEERMQCLDDCFDAVYTAADSGDAEARYLISLLKLNPQDFPDDQEYVTQALEQSAQSGSASACYLLGERNASTDLGQRNTDQAIYWFERCTELGSSYGVYGLARLYGGEESPLKDPQKAVGYARQAAVSGNGDAMEYLAFAYFSGDGVEQDLAMSRDYFRQAAELGDAEGAGKLASMLIEGEGGAVDLAGARSWLQRIHIEEYQPYVDELLAKIDALEEVQ